MTGNIVYVIKIGLLSIFSNLIQSFLIGCNTLSVICSRQKSRFVIRNHSIQLRCWWIRWTGIRWSSCISLAVRPSWGDWSWFWLNRAHWRLRRHIKHLWFNSATIHDPICWLTMRIFRELFYFFSSLNKSISPINLRISQKIITSCLLWSINSNNFTKYIF